MLLLDNSAWSHLNSERLDDNFFDIGGTSLLLVSVQARLQVLFDKKISVADLFVYTTVRALSQNLGGVATGSGARHSMQDQAEKQRAAFARARAARKVAP
jgi:hypothetical protein